MAMSIETVRTYENLRRKGWATKAAWRRAKLLSVWQEAVASGLVRLNIVADDSFDMENLKGDTFNRECNPEIQESRMAREEKEFENRVESEGVWGIVGEWRLRTEDEWEQADACWGFVGDDWKESGYDYDIMKSTLDALDGARIASFGNVVLSTDDPSPEAVDASWAHAPFDSLR